MSFFHYDVLRTNRSAISENVTPLTSLQEFEYKVYYVPKKSVHFVFGDFPLPIMLNVHVFGTKIKIRTCTLLERSSDLSNSGEFKRQTASEIAI